MGQQPPADGSFSKCLGSKEKKAVLSFLGSFHWSDFSDNLPSSSPERKELRRCFEPKVFCFIPTPCCCTSTPCWCAGNYLPLTFSVLSRIVTTFFRLASPLKPVWVYTARRSSACSSVPYNIAGPSAEIGLRWAPVLVDCSTSYRIEDCFCKVEVRWYWVLLFCGHCLLEGNCPLVDEMADTTKRKITKKSSSFSYDRRRDSVKVRRQSKSLSFKSATLGAQKRQKQKKQVCIWVFLK